MQLAHALAFTQYGSAPGRSVPGAAVPDTAVPESGHVRVSVRESGHMRVRRTHFSEIRHQYTHLTEIRHLPKRRHRPARRGAAESSLSQMAHFNELPVDGDGRVAWRNDLGKHADELRVVPVLSGKPTCLVILLAGHEPPIKIVSRIMAEQRPKHALRPTVALPKRMNEVVVVVVIASRSMNVGRSSPLSMLSRKSSECDHSIPMAILVDGRKNSEPSRFLRISTVRMRPAHS